MGFITNQWLKGYPERNRSFSPVDGAVTGSASDDSWSKARNVVLEIKVRRSGGNYQLVFLTQEEINKLLPIVMPAGDQSVRIQVALSVLSGLSDAELLKAMGSLLAKRAKAGEPPKQS